MQRPSDQQRREDSSQFLQQLESEAAIHHQSQRRPSEQGPSSRPISPLLAPPSVKARPSSVVGDKLITNTIPADNTAIPTTATIRTVSKDKDSSDSPPQSPIAFLDSPRPLIQTQDPETSLVENTTPAQSNATTSAPQPSSSTSAYWSSSSTSIPTPTASQSAPTAANHLIARGDIRAPSPTLLPSSTASAYSQQRSALKAPSPLNTTAPSAERGANAIAAGNAVSGSTGQRYTSTGYLQQPSFQPRSSKTPGSPISPKEEKKKKGWLSFLGGSSKDTSSSSASTASTQQPPRNNPSQRVSQEPSPSPFRREKSNQKPNQSPLPPTSQTKEAKPQRSGSTLQSSSSLQQPAPRVLQKKKKTRQTEKKQQQVYQNPRANNNSPEPSIVSRLTNEEQNHGRKDSDATVSTTDNNNLSTRPRHLQRTSLEISENIPSRSISLLGDLESDLERSIEPPFSQAQYSDNAEQSSEPDWETRFGEGEDYNTRSASKGETFTLESAGASAQTQRAELKHREDRFGGNSRPPSRQSIDSPTTSEVNPGQSTHQQKVSAQNSNQSTGYMGGSGGQQPPTGRNGESQNSSGTTREGQYGANLSVNNNQQSATSYRNTPQASPMVQDTGANAGRSTPPPAASGANKSREDLNSMDLQQLHAKYEELSDKYRKVKKYYFDKDSQLQTKDGQVQALQNQLAHQRLAQSRTNLDDNDYMARFARLDGAINNLAFNVRKDWKAVPSWLSHCVNKDATAIVTKEMTAVGRACISRWLVDEVFDRYFHPGLEPHLSCQLKVIERNIRRFLPLPQTDEEKESHVAKMSNWRLSTLDGLKGVLESAESKQYRDELTHLLVTMLTEDLRDNLKEPTPAGLDAGVSGIIELAVGLAANIPYESRDIFVDYIMPGRPVNEAVMKVEAALPALTNPGEGPNDQERSSMDNGDDRENDNEFGTDGGTKKKGILGSLMGGRGKSQEGSFPKDERVRFAAFMVVESRGGTTVLVKAPVYV